MNKRPINPTDKLRAIIGEGNVDGSNSRRRILKALEFYGIYDNKGGALEPEHHSVSSSGRGYGRCQRACALNVGPRTSSALKYSSVFYGAKVDGAVDRNNSEGRGGAIPSLGEIRNCHISVGTGKTPLRELSGLVWKAAVSRGG